MKSNINNFLSKTITTYTFLLVIIFILKLVGLDYFGIDLNNEIVRKVTNLINSNRIVNNLYHMIPLIFYQYITISIIINDKSSRLKIYCLLFIPITYVLQANKISLFGSLSFVIEILYYYIMVLIYCKMNVKKFKIKRFIFTIILTLILQIISMLTRVNYSLDYVNNPIANFIINLDYFLLMIIAYKLNFVEGGIKIWTDGFLDQVGSSSLKKIRLSKLLKKLQRNLDNFKKRPKVEKIEITIYIILSLFWNVLSLVLILFVAKLNDTFVECIFILTSFWLSKGTFGKSFHFSSMTKCFIVSNLTYYALNRITTPLGISIIVPIILGVGLSYVTSKFVKSPITKLYKGMPEDEFNSNILNVTDKDSLQYKICHMFYIERKSELEIAHNVGYSIDNIKKIKSKINKKIKELN